MQCLPGHHPIVERNLLARYLLIRLMTAAKDQNDVAIGGGLDGQLDCGSPINL